MDIQLSEPADGIALVVPTESIDTATSGSLRDCLMRLAQEGRRRVVVGLSPVRSIHSSDLSALVAAANGHGAAGSCLVLCSAPAGVLRILQLTQLDEYSVVAADRAEARMLASAVATS